MGRLNFVTRLVASGGMGVALAVAGYATVMADPFDPICIMPPEDYCTYMEGHTVGTPGFRECYQRAMQAQWSEYCNPVGLTSATTNRE